jgi:hypothetical protein
MASQSPEKTVKIQTWESQIRSLIYLFNFC